ncbi:MAG TPA: cytochrome c family protein [Hyphomicrobiaceae bacterium]|nr:cytochrome c family protein [Hyphomicrobiaceae bacterium]
MDGYKFNKFAGGALSALLFIFGAKTLVEITQHSSHASSKLGIELPAAAKGATATAAPAAAKYEFAKLKPLLEKASVEEGEVVFKPCVSCHTVEKGGPNRVGPNLYGIIGRKVASVGGFEYSEPMKKKGGDWTFDTLGAFLYDPKGTVPDTKMVFNGVQDMKDLADLIGYLRKHADAPAELPK